MDRPWEDAPWRSRSWIGAAWNENSDDWGYTESDDAMVDLQRNEVLVDHQTYTIPTGFNDKTSAVNEKRKPYITMVVVNGKRAPCCKLCGKWGECDSHFKGQDHLRHLFLPSDIFQDPDLWKVPQTMEGQLKRTRQFHTGLPQTRGRPRRPSPSEVYSHSSTPSSTES